MSELKRCRNPDCTEEHPEFYARMGTCKKCYNRKTYLKRKKAFDAYNHQESPPKELSKVIEDKDKEISTLIGIIDTLTKRLDTLSV